MVEAASSRARSSLPGRAQFAAACTPDDDVARRRFGRCGSCCCCCGGCGGCGGCGCCGGCGGSRRQQRLCDCCWRRLLLASHAVEHRLRGIKRRDGRVAALDEDGRARREQNAAHGLQLPECDGQLLRLLLLLLLLRLLLLLHFFLQFFLSAAARIRVSLRPRVRVPGIMAPRRRRRARWGRRVSSAWNFSRVRAIFLPALHVRFFSSVVPVS